MRTRATNFQMREDSRLSWTFCSGDGFNCYICSSSQIKRAHKTGTRTQRGPAPSGPLRSGSARTVSVFRDGQRLFDCRGKMPFYQVLCIAAHNPEYVRDKPFLSYALFLSFYAPQRQIKSLVRLAGTHILNNGGVVRGIQYWGTETLPQRMRSHGTNHDHGEYVPSPFSYRLLETYLWTPHPQLLDDAF